MAELLIRNEWLASKLMEIAHRERRSVEEVLESMVAEHRVVESDEPEPGTFAALARSAERAGIRSAQPVDTSIRSREILQTEFGDYLKRRLDDQSNTD